jgi:SAM-dependent methyltransferase
VLAELGKGINILDVATGSGAVLLPAAEVVGSQGQVIGVDLSPAMVQRVRQELERRAPPTIEVRQMDAEDLQFPGETFDVVLCGFGLFFFPQLGQALAEFRRVLRPQGRIAVSTWGPDDERWQWLDELTQAYTAAVLSAPQPAPGPASAPVFNTPEGLTALMSTAGFTQTHVIVEEMEVVYANAEEWWQAQWSHGGRKRLEAIEGLGGVVTLERFKAEVFAKLESMRAADGLHQRFRVLYTVARKPAS